MIQKEYFDTYRGKDIFKYTLQGDITVSVLTLGARIYSIVVPDKSGKPVDVALNFTNAEDIIHKSAYMGATVGRFGNRIGDSRFTLNGKTYHLPHEEGKAHLHGGLCGFDQKVFDAELDGDGVRMHYISPDGEEGYPGTLDFSVKFTVVGSTLEIEYSAESDADTILNPTNHCYFNLNGEGDGSILDNILQINADCYLPTDQQLIPTGEIKSVANTPLDFRTPKAIGRDINADDADLKTGGGYDHNFCLNDRHAATAYSEKTGIVMECFTDRPGMQFYSGNFMTARKGKSLYGYRSGFCLETQLYPDCVNKPDFASPVLKQGEKFYSKTAYHFSLK